MAKSKECDNLDQLVHEGMEESQLMEAVATCLGDEVRRFAESRCGSRGGDVEDISQDAMLAAHRYLGSFRGEASLRTWLYRLVLSACSRRRRGRKNDPKLHRPMEENSEADPANPEVVLLISERLAALEDAMEELRPEDRRLLAAVEWEGKSLQQAADENDLSLSAVKSRLFRIRGKLKELVTEKFQQKSREAAS